jgi:adenylylsulfate kinase
MISRLQKEKFLNQKAIVIWLTGLSGAGKTTLSEHLSKALFEKGFFTQLLDGDQIRNGINNNLGFSDEEMKIFVVLLKFQNYSSTQE